MTAPPAVPWRRRPVLGEDEHMEEFPTSARQQAQAAAWFVSSHPKVIRLTPGQRDRIVREVQAERSRRSDLPRPA
jgi:hypothetical protein